MATVNALERKNNKNESKIHFARTSAVLAMLGTFKLHHKGLLWIFFRELEKKITKYLISFFLFFFLFFWGGYSYYSTYCLKAEVEWKKVYILYLQLI